MIKVERSQPAPESLRQGAKTAPDSYRKPDVIARLKEDFHDKCYICELKGLQDPQVEHLRPHEGDKHPELKFDWNNLFWCCGHCNSVKNQAKYAHKILDCCVRDPEQAIQFGLSGKDVDVKALETDEEALRTAELVQEVFTLRNTGMRIEKCDIRLRGLLQEMDVLYRALEEYIRNPDNDFVLRRLRVLLKRDTPFAGFKRCYVRRHIARYPKLAEFLL